MDKFGGEHLDICQNIEFAIIEVYRADPSLLDIDVKDAIDVLVRVYHAEEAGRTPPAFHLDGRALRVFEDARKMCEFRLGRAAIDDGGPVPAVGAPALVACLRDIQKSIPRWSKQGGRRGYLDFVKNYIR